MFKQCPKNPLQKHKDIFELINEDFEVNAKGEERDLVTNFDLKTEKYIINKIEPNYPDFSIISEKYNYEKKLYYNCFIIDTIDGPINFAHNIPL